VLQVAQQERLVAENPTLAASLARREAYLGPLNFLQVRLIRQVRATADPTASPWMKPLLRSINAIAAGMRNTG
jgi:phosphoenolpyruvate carboxylase